MSANPANPSASPYKVQRFGFSGFAPLYDVDGNIEKIFSLKALEALAAAEKITLVRSRTGLIVRAFRRKNDKSTNLTLAPYLGTVYSYREQLNDGHRCADLTRLGRRKSGPNDKNYAPAHLRPIFLRVVTDCITECPTPAAPIPLTPVINVPAAVAPLAG